MLHLGLEVKEGRYQFLVLAYVLGLKIASLFEVRFSFGVQAVGMVGCVLAMLALHLSTQLVRVASKRQLFYVLCVLLGCLRVGHTSHSLPQGTFDARVLDHPETSLRGTQRVDLQRLGKEGGVIRLVAPQSCALEKGSTLRIHARVRPFENRGNAREYNIEAYAASRGILGQVRVERCEDLHVFASPTLGQRTLNAVREHRLRKLQGLLSPNAHWFFQAIILGNGQALNPKDRPAYLSTGVLHALVVSGGHLVVVFGFMQLLLAGMCRVFLSVLRFKNLELVLYILGVGAVYAYGEMICQSLPSSRALIWMGGWTLARLWRCRWSSVQVYWAFVGAYVLWSPHVVEDISFLLSFGGCLMLIDSVQRIPFASWILRYPLTYLWVSLPIYLTLWVKTHSLELAAVPLSLVLTPLISLGFIPLGVALLSGVLPSSIEGGAGQLFSFSVDVWERGLDWAASYEFPVWSLQPAAVLMIWVMAVLAYYRMLGIRRWLCLLGVLTSALGLSSPDDSPGYPFVSILNVGQGTSVIHRAETGHILMLDTGPKSRSGWNAGDAVIVPWLRAHGIKKIDVLVLSHADLDHVGGAEAILDQIPVGTLILPSGRTHAPYLPLIAAASRASTRILWWEDGSSLTLGTTYVQALHPKYGRRGQGDNETGLVIAMQVQGRQILLPGDIGFVTEEDLIDTERLLPVDLLHVGHHGSRHSTSDEWLEVLSPRYAAISVGQHNRYGHPHRDVLSRLEEAQVQVFRTDQQGELRFVFAPMWDEIRTYQKIKPPCGPIANPEIVNISKRP